MSSTSMPPHGFVTVRGRGYRPEQVDAFAAALSRERDDAWERAARLTVLAKDMAVEAERLRERVARLAPQSYETLGERARRIFQLGVEEAAVVRDGAEREAHERVTRAEAHALAVRRAAQERADVVRAEGEERARQRLLAARAEADDERIGARREVKELRSEALAALREVRQRTSGMLADQAKEQAERWAAAEREEVERVAALDAHHVERAARAEAALSEARRVFGAAEESARRCLEQAQARAAQMLAEARVHEDRIARETEQVLREHEETRGDVQAHMDYVRSSLTSLMGRAALE
ncbi:cellulose-binding protein [Streptomyces sp. NPDC046805]|uniref:cellulose-binding protein n=1 Tax=Streptomyces sp. NPDC046805 TaxID=3155134 RepID=UPI0033EF4B2A